ncbi:MAG TPA: hypothetical protein VHJ40_08990, partial [Actinomycetota bacterium]|nr:hypothetical protein [Actinomycetota bacterium]
KVVALERNAQLAGMLQSSLAARSGGIYNHPRVQLLAGNPRSYLESQREKFDVISLSLSEGRRTVTAGAFSLSENYLLTAEALDQYFDHLEPDGILVVHRWLQLPPTEELRAAALVIEALRGAGAGAAPDRNIIAIRSFSTMLILAKLEPFTSQEIATAKDFVAGRQFDFVHYPGIQPSDTNLSNVLRNDRYFSSFGTMLSDRQRFYRDYEYEVRPPTDDHPFFFHFFKWGQTPTVLRLLGKTWQPFGGSGYLIVLALLVVTAVLSLALILLPAWTIRRRERGLGKKQGWVRPVTYFGALGLGFLLVEVALVGRLILFLDHSALGFTVVLFGLLVSSGLGSAWSARIPWRTALAVLSGVILLYAAFLPPVSSMFLGRSLGIRVVITLLLLTPLGFLMGIAFPNGLRWIGAERPSWLPMAWGVNGFTSVIGAIIAAMIALSWGFTAVLVCGAAAYLMALAAIWRRSPLPAPSPDRPFQEVSSAPLAD